MTEGPCVFLCSSDGTLLGLLAVKLKRIKNTTANGKPRQRVAYIFKRGNTDGNKYFLAEPQSNNITN